MSETNEVKEEEEYLSPFIHDGYTLTATIPAVPGRWSKLFIRYRPMSPDEESEVFAQSRLNPAAPLTEFYAPIMAEKILGWDMKRKNKEGVLEKVPITETVLRKNIAPALYDQLKMYVDGTLTGDQEKN